MSFRRFIKRPQRDLNLELRIAALQWATVCATSSSYTSDSQEKEGDRRRLSQNLITYLKVEHLLISIYLPSAFFVLDSHEFDEALFVFVYVYKKLELYPLFQHKQCDVTRFGYCVGLNYAMRNSNSVVLPMLASDQQLASYAALGVNNRVDTVCNVVSCSGACSAA